MAEQDAYLEIIALLLVLEHRDELGGANVAYIRERVAQLMYSWQPKAKVDG